MLGTQETHQPSLVVSTCNSGYVGPAQEFKVSPGNTASKAKQAYYNSWLTDNCTEIKVSHE